MDMTLDVTQKLIGLDGDALKDPEGKEVALRIICINALMAPLEADKGMTGTKKVEIWTLAGKIHNEDKPFLTAEEVALLKDRIGTAFTQAVVGPAFLLLNGTPGKTLKLADAEKK